jgi:hypothetical protein
MNILKRFFNFFNIKNMFVAMENVYGESNDSTDSKEIQDVPKKKKPRRRYPKKPKTVESKTEEKPTTEKPKKNYRKKPKPKPKAE